MRPLALFVLIFALSLLAFSPANGHEPSGEYFGRIRSGDGWYDVATNFDKMTYRTTNGCRGTLRPLGVYEFGHLANGPQHRHLYEWKDQAGKGLLWVHFRGQRFDGEWAFPCKTSLRRVWDGYKGR